MFEEYTRALTPRERRALKLNIKSASIQPAKTWRDNATSSFGCIGVLLVLTIIATWGKWMIMFTFTPILLLLAAYLTISGAISDRRQQAATIGKFESALRRDEAHVVHVVASEMVELKEEEDEGACYAFQVDEDRIFFLSGQDYYATSRFPNTDFSIVEVYDENGQIVHWLFDNQGEKLKPVRKISAKKKRDFRDVHDREIIEGRLANLEQILTQQN